MPITAEVDDITPTRPPGVHSLLLCETVREQRDRTAAWVDRQLTGGAKVYYKAQPAGDRSGSGGRWLTDAGGVAGAAAALEAGQLEVVEFPEVLRRSGGSTAGMRQLQLDEVTRGLEEGWPRVAMSQESPGLALADEAEAAEYAEQEAGFDLLAQRWPVDTLCQLTLLQETPAAAWEYTAVHYAGILDHQWSAHVAQGRWWLRGELDAHVVQRFAAALHGAMRTRQQVTSDPDLHIDVSAVEFFDVAAAQSLMLAARVHARRQRIWLHGASEAIRDVIAAVGRPGTLLFAAGGVVDE